jgi:2',3'-cyclic-nucleotide 2'-phosphodiesterase (5'-nucleotidase family)
VGALTLTATATRAQAPITTANVRLAETEAGNLVADALREATGADIAFVPAAAFRANASAPREATAEQAAGLLEPATDPVMIMNLKGSQILAALERSVWFAAQPFAGYLQVSGLRFAFDARKDAGSRVADVTVNGAPIDAGRVYKVALPRPLANGQQGYFQIWGKGQGASETGKTLRSTLDEVSKRGAFSPALDGRIARKDP